MSRQNKVNPGMYTQRGRLTQDDAARELRKQSTFGSPHTWQPVNTRRPRLAPAGSIAPGAARDTERPETSPPRAKAKTTRTTTRRAGAARKTGTTRKTATARKTATSRKTAADRRSGTARRTGTDRRTVTARRRATTKNR